METRTYQAVTMAKALVEVKRDLGPAAVILHTRRFRKGGMLGFIGGRTMWEVQASGNVNVLPRSAKGQYLPTTAPPGELASDTDGQVAAAEQAMGANQAALADKMSEIHRMVGTLLDGGPDHSVQDLPQPLADLRQHLLDQDVEADIADELIGELRSGLTDQEATSQSLLAERLTELIAGRIKTTGGRSAPSQTSHRKLIALIGPTGVGKTTTIAKLAANYKIREKKSVGLITIDTYRIAAVDQLRTYAEIIQVPLDVVLTPGELHRAIQATSGLDVVLIDTAGRSQNNEMRLNELQRFTEAAGCDQVHVVVSAAGSPRVAAAAMERFAALGANGVIISKLDEAATFGMILNIASRSEAPIGYVTTGQDVPDDIAPADPSVLAKCIMRGSWYAS